MRITSSSGGRFVLWRRRDVMAIAAYVPSVFGSAAVGLLPYPQPVKQYFTI